MNFYSTNQLLEEIEDHRGKLKLLSGYSETELDQIIHLVTRKIRFISIRLIPLEIFGKAAHLTHDADINDTEFVALAEHAKAKL